MSGPSSRCERGATLVALAIAAALGGCHKKPTPAPEADPAKVTALAKALVENTPAPAGVRQCAPADFATAASLTQLTVLQLAGEPVSAEPTRAVWTNPPELDHPAARRLVEPGLDETSRRQAAAELLAATSFVVYRVDMVNAPLALGVKELKRGALGMRAIGYDARGAATCITVFVVQNDKAKSEWAMDKSDRAQIDPAVVQAMRDDLRDQLLAQAAAFGTKITPVTAPMTAPPS